MWARPGWTRFDAHAPLLFGGEWQARARGGARQTTETLLSATRRSPALGLK
jgi:hypothetical protein